MKVDGVGTLIYPIKVTIPDTYIEEVETGSKSLKVTVADIKYSGVSNYELAYRIKGTKKWNTKSFSSDSTVLDLTGLENGKQYELAVRAFTEDAYGKYCGKYCEAELSDVLGTNTLNIKGLIEGANKVEDIAEDNGR